MLNNMVIALNVLFLFCSISYAQIANQPEILERAAYSDAVHIGSILDSGINEASGLAPSRLYDEVLWVINDSGNPPVLYAVDGTGWVLGEFMIQGVRNIDWEDLASFRINGISYIMIADMGDNMAVRRTCSLFMIREPDIKASEKPLSLPVSGAIEFKYEDGPRDCESAAVDTVQKKILLLSKRTLPPVIYELPLMPEGTHNVMVAKRTAELKNIPPPTREDINARYGKYRSQPTAMDISSNGTNLAVLTYKHAYLYTRGAGQDWGDAVSEKPKRIILPLPDKGELSIREALCFAGNSMQLFVTSELTPAPIYRLDPIGK
jgi:hypothetical protein